MNLVAVEHVGGDLARAVGVVRKNTDLPLLLICSDVEKMARAAEACRGMRPLLHPATAMSFADMAKLAKENGCILGVQAPNAEGLAELTPKIRETGVEDLLLEPGPNGFLPTLHELIRLRRLCLKKVFRPLGHPTMAFVPPNDPLRMAAQATASICKYA